ncbi:MAG: hypothetical protein WAM63_08540, partial [Rhodomicrobium sp.]
PNVSKTFVFETRHSRPFLDVPIHANIPAEGNTMPTAKNIFENIDEDAEARAIEEAELAIEEGRVVPHEEVVKWLQSWGTPNELPRPKPR